MLSIGPPTTISPNLLGLEGSKRLNGDPDNSALTGGASRTSTLLSTQLTATATTILLPAALALLYSVYSSCWSHSLKAIGKQHQSHRRQL